MSDDRHGHTRLVADLDEQLERCAWAAARRPGARHTSRGKLLPRERVDRLLDQGAPFLELSPLAAHGMYDGDAPGAGIVTGVGRVRGPRVRDRRQRRDGQGRHLLPDDGQEAPARAGGRAAQPAAVHLPRGLRRRVPAAAGRGLPRPRALRADLLQPGDDVRARHPADRGRDGLVHGGRRLRAGDERRVRDRPRAGHDLPRRPAAGEGRDGGGGHRGGARRRRPALAHVAASPTTSPTTTSTRWRSSATSSPRCRRRPGAVGARARRGAARTTPTRSTASSPPTCASRTTRTS